MQTTVRAAIMLTVLVGLPAAWVYYGPLPPPAQRVVDRFVTTAQEALGWELGVADGHRVAPRRATPAGRTQQNATRAALSPAPPMPTLADRAEPVLEQLRAWGAEEYRLEPWGLGGRLFRFACEMPLVEGAGATRLFDAVAVEPIAAIEEVVAEVASWRSAELTAMR